MAGSSKSKAAEDFPPLPAKPDIGQTSPSPAAPSTQDVLLQQILTMQKQQSELLEMQRQQAEDHRLLRADHQRLAQINVELEAKLYDLHGNKTYDSLSKKSNSSMKYECMVLAPALSYLHDVVTACNQTLDEHEDVGLSLRDLLKHCHEVTNSVHGVYALLCNRWTMLELRGQLEQEPGSSQRGGQEALRAKLQFVEDRVYQAADGVVADEVLQQWLNDFDKKPRQSSAEHCVQERGQRGNAGSERSTGPSEVMQWITHGVKLRWKRGPPPPFDHGVSLRDATRQQQVWLDAEKERLLENGAWTRATRRSHVSRAFLVPKPGTNKWRLVVDFRWLNQWCVKNRVKMETLKKLRRLAKPGDWCFSFDLQDGFHALGIHPDFQKFMQFDLQGDLLQCSAMPFGWSDSPRVFCKFVRVMVEALRSPQAAEDRREIKRLRDGSAVRQRWSVRRRTGGAGGDANRHSGMRVLPYMDDFLVLVDSQREGFLRREKVQLVLHRLGLRRNEKKGHWEPTQVVEHLGLEVDLKLGQFRVTERRVHKIHAKAKEILCDAARNRRWIPARRLASFTGLCQSVYLAVPAARLYLRELYFVLAEKRSWGAKVKISRSARGDLEWWSRLPVMSRWNGRKIWRSPTRAKVHTDSSMTAWGGVLNLKFPARGFWPDEMRCWHITHLELEAVYKTVQAFLQELEGKVVRLYCDNQAVVAMLSHFTSRNPDLMRRMRRLWLLLDLHDIELQARYIRSEANVWADNLSRCEDLDDWRLNRDWFVWANKQWGPYTVDRFASEISAQLPRYYAAWKDPKCEGVDSLTYDWRGENNWVNPPWALLDEVAHKLREEGAAATVVAPYWPGQSWFRELEALATEVVIMPRRRDLFTPSRLGGSELLGPSKWDAVMFFIEARPLVQRELQDHPQHGRDTDADGENTERSSGGNYEEYKRGGAVQNFLTRSLCERWRSELGPSRLTELAVSMQRKALLDTTKDNYGPKARRFILFCERDQRPWLPASEATVLLYIASLLEDGNIQSASLQPYLSAINNYHEDLGHPGPAKGRSVTRAGKGMATIQAELAEQEENIETQRTWLPAAHVRRVHEAALKFNPRSPEELKLLRALTYVVVAFVTFGRPDTGTSLSRQHVHCGDEEFSVVLLKEKGRRHHRVKRRLTIPWKGVALLKELIEHWEFYRDTAWSISAKTQPDSYWLLPEDPKNFKASVANDWIGLALSELDCRPPEGGHFSAHSTRKGATTCARAVGVTMEKVCFLGGWSQFSSAVQHYIDPTALRDTDMDYYFAWLTWSQ
ncbi:hypothetical protein CYMTET_8181 [Cymbomonas tetramitiformis]|uniref:Reverse transcriptase domain-containing protein n=1 Tax=Cymbomonas tetramitiformis TaxID=36881 RepID=A0AAE0GU03_9CHLO|nr:hypothetical protein CYMTET_8181 [Cymbomonas tetramitiformis]